MGDCKKNKLHALLAIIKIDKLREIKSLNKLEIIYIGFLF